MPKLLRGPQLFLIPLLMGAFFFYSHLIIKESETISYAPVSIGSPVTLETAYQRWKRSAIQSGQENQLVLPIGHSRGLSNQYTKAWGLSRLDLQDGTLSIEINDFEDNTDYEVWFFDNVQRPGSSTKPEPHDARFLVGSLHASDGSAELTTQISTEHLGSFDLDLIVIVPTGTNPEENGLLFGSPSLFQRFYYHEQQTRMAQLSGKGTINSDASELWQAPFTALVPTPAFAKAFGTVSVDSLIAVGENLFHNETFGGNGRTCGSCHPANNNFTIDPAFIATLPPTDPLFIADLDTALAQLEDSVLLKDFGLILENVDGLEDPTNKFVMRGVPHTLGMAFSLASGSVVPPLDRTGWGGDGAPGMGTIRDFATGATRQHLTKTLNRVVGVDFVFPTEPQLDAIEAYTLSLGRPSELQLGSLQLTDAVADSGRKLFTTTDSNFGTQQAGKCQLCHRNAGAIGVVPPNFFVNDNFDNGLENRTHPAEIAHGPMPRDGGFGTAFDSTTGGFGDGTFNTPSLIETADTPPFFHNNIDTDLRVAVAFYSTPQFNNSPAGVLIKSLDSGGVGITVGPDEITAFLRVINVLENLRSTIDLQSRAVFAPDLPSAEKLLSISQSEIEDAVTVLTQGSLHPDALPLLTSADSLISLAKVNPDRGQRNAQIDAAVVNEMDARNLMVVGGVTDVAGAEPRITIELGQNLPNPFNRGTVISYRTPNSGKVRLKVFDVSGRLVQVLIDKTQKAGHHTVQWDGRARSGSLVASGTYYYQLEIAGQRQTKSMVLIR